MSNVINLFDRKPKQSEKKPLLQKEENPTVEKVVDLNEKRAQQVVTSDRRKSERVLLSDFISVQVVVPGFGLIKASLYDIHENGVSFDMESRHGKFKVGEEVALRVYLNRESYFPITVKTKHATYVVDEDVNRHGAEFVKASSNDVALHHLVKFLENASRSLRSDKGDLNLNRINS
jgi:hypothetical protein